MSHFSGEPEQRQLGANGVDVIDELCEASVFDDAARYLTRSSLKLSNDQKLTFYALFKQATVGPCNTPKPSILHMKDRAKWSAWNDLGKLSKDEAIVRYVAELEKVSPSWREQAGVMGDDDSDDEGGRGVGGGAGGDGAMIMPQSRPIGEPEVAVADLPEALKDVHFWAKQGDMQQLRTRIEKGVSVNARDEEGRTPLHWAVDRGHDAIARMLVSELKADVDAQDSDGASALHYAALCEHLPLVTFLLMSGADPSVVDSGGESAAEAVRAVQGVTPDVLQLLETAKSKSS